MRRDDRESQEDQRGRSWAPLEWQRESTEEIDGLFGNFEPDLFVVLACGCSML